MSGWWSWPLLHFLAIGGLLFALVGRPGADPVAPPDPPEPLSDEALLLAEARALGLHEGDALVRRRLIRNMRFVGDEPGRGDAALFAEALALGMDESDPVVRRRLVQLRILDAQAAARRHEPSDAELAGFLARQPERFARPARVRLSQVFLSRARRGAALQADAQRLLARLAATRTAPEAAGELGDPLPLPSHGPPRSRDELAARLGPAFAREVFGLATGAWRGPVESSYGLHLVWVHAREPARPAPLEAVRGAVREALLEERAEMLLAERLAWLRAAR